MHTYPLQHVDVPTSVCVGREEAFVSIISFGVLERDVRDFFLFGSEQKERTCSPCSKMLRHLSETCEIRRRRSIYFFFEVRFENSLRICMCV